MQLLNSETLLDILIHQKILTAKQRQFITLEKGKQRQKLLRTVDKGSEIDKNYPDMVEIITAFNMKLSGNNGRILDEETIMRAVAKEKKLPFKKLDPLELDMDVATKTIPRNFAIRQLILPFNLENGIPSHDTFGRVFGLIDPEEFQICFSNWILYMEIPYTTNRE